MTNLTRRKFCSLLLLTIAAPIGSSSADAIAPNSIRNSSNEPSSALNECESVYKEWIKNEKMSPAQYFFQKIQEYQLNPQQTSEATTLDFEHNNFFEVNGLKLGKTEASFLAIIGSNIAM